MKQCDIVDKMSFFLSNTDIILGHCYNLRLILCLSLWNNSKMPHGITVNLKWDLMSSLLFKYSLQVGSPPPPLG